MRILQITTAYYPELQFGGPPQKIHALSRGLTARGHDVRVITFHSNEPRARQHVVYDGVTVQYVPWHGRGVWQLPWGGTCVRDAVNWSDVIHCYGYYNLLDPLAAHYAQGSRRPYVLEPMGMYVPIVHNLVNKNIYRRLIGNRLAMHAARLIATSAQEQAELIAAGLDPCQVLVRRNGIDLAAFQNLPARGAFRQCHGLGERDWLILFLGRLSPKKGLALLLDAFARAALPEARLVLVGPDDGSGYERELRRRAATLSLAQQVICAGPLYDDQKLEALADADIFVLPSRNENFGNAVAEAVAASVPVIISRQCGIAPYIEHRVGLVIDGEVTALVEALRQLSCDLALWREFRANCPVAAQDFSWEGPLQQMEQIYQEIILECANIKPLEC